MALNWKDPQREPESRRAEHWDSLSASFDGYESQNAGNNIIIKFLEDRGMVGPDMRVLDIGCAAGKYSIYFAGRCREVVGTDISPEMIRRAEANAEQSGCSNIRFIRSDWENLNLDDIGGEGSFDLVFASITPAISSEKDLDKMLKAAGGWCYYGGTARAKRKIADRIHAMFSLPLTVRGNERSIPYVFSQLWEAGIRPEIDYLPDIYRHDMTFEEACVHYRDTIGSMLSMYQGSPFSPEQDKMLRSFLERENMDGIIHEEFKSVTAALTWNMKDIR